MMSIIMSVVLYVETYKHAQVYNSSVEKRRKRKTYSRWGRAMHGSIHLSINIQNLYKHTKVTKKKHLVYLFHTSYALF